MKQLELFSQDIGGARPEGRERPFFFLKNYEKILLLVIGCIVVASVAYCVGVERGKRSFLSRGAESAVPSPKAGKVILKQHERVVSPVLPGPRPASAATPLPASPAPAPIAPVKYPIVNVEKNTGKEYTVQVASYETRKLAENEMRRLKTRGFIPMAVNKGKFTIVCVGNFADKEQAKSMLSKLKGTYSDCYIRRL